MNYDDEENTRESEEGFEASDEEIEEKKARRREIQNEAW